MNPTSRIYVAGHRGLVGSALYRRLQSNGYVNLTARSHSRLNLSVKSDVEEFFAEEKPEYVLLAAAKVGGIYANYTYPVDFLLGNLNIQNNVIEAAWRTGVKGLLFLGSSCIYPRDAPQPLKEEYLLTGPLEPTNEAYAIAKIAGIELCKAYNRQYGTRFLGVMPTNLYGPNDSYDLQTSHALPALIRKFHLAKLAVLGDFEGIRRDEACYGKIPNDILAGLEAKRGVVVRLWGTGAPCREFLHVDDMAEACVFLMQRLEELFSDPCSSVRDRPIINIGCGKDNTIREVAEMVARVAGFDGTVEWDSSKPDGTPKKLLDVSRMSDLGWKAGICMEEGLRNTYEDYLRKLAGSKPCAM